MPKLGDYIGQLLSEITVARMRADIEAVKIAELYADHPLLRHMPVPHFRMPDVEIDVPVVIKDFENQTGSESSTGNPPIKEVRKVFDRVATSLFTKRKLTVTAANKKKMKEMLDERVSALTRPSEVAIDMNRISRDFSRNTVKMLGSLIKPEEQVEVEEQLNDALRVELIKIRIPPTRLNVLATTAEVREAGPDEVITRLHLKISEEAFEWSSIESDEGKVDRLVIE